MMNIETKYNIGQNVWVAKINNGGDVIEVYDTIISGIYVTKNKILYNAIDTDEDYTDEDLMSQEEYENELTSRVRKLMQKIHDDEENGKTDNNSKFFE